MVRYQPPMDWQQWVHWLAAGLHGRSRVGGGRRSAFPGSCKAI